MCRRLVYISFNQLLSIYIPKNAIITLEAASRFGCTAHYTRPNTRSLDVIGLQTDASQLRLQASMDGSHSDVLKSNKLAADTHLFSFIYARGDRDS